jgi:predicted dehydrogenase
LTVLQASTALELRANSAMTVGVIGCGGRGNHDAGNFVRFTNSTVTALADPYQDRLDSTSKKFAEGSPKTFVGFDGYKKLLETDVDTVIITSPPYFHPQHFEETVDAGKHCYFEKPIAVDIPGTTQVLKAGKKAEGKQTVMVGFQMRYKPDLQWAVKRVREGAIGGLICGQAHYHSGWLGPRHTESMPALEQRIRNWVFDIALSGDILVEQNIHVLDVCNWIIGAHPLKVYGTGGRRARTFFGDTWDHYEVTYVYPGDVHLVFNSTQFLNLGWGDVGERFNGSKGALDALVGPARIRNTEKQEEAFEGELNNPEEAKIKHFFQSVESKDYINEVEQAVEATRTAILGRNAAYRKTEYTWAQMLNDNETIDANLGI